MQELEAYCYRAAGALQTVAAAALAGERPLTESDRRFARQLGSTQRQVEMIRDIHHDLRRGRMYLPLDSLDAAGLDPTALSRLPAPPALQPLVDAWRARVAAALAALPILLPDSAQRSAQRSGLVLAALHQRLLAQTARIAAEAVTRAELGPAARLWTAWRTAVRYS